MHFFPIPPHITSHHITSHHITSHHITSPLLSSPLLSSPHLTSPHLTSPHLTSPHLTSPHLTSPHLTPPHSTLLDHFLLDGTVCTSHRYEAQEPLVTGAVLTGDAAIPGRQKSGSKLRPLTAEEIAAAQSAERTVMAALEKHKALPPSSVDDGPKDAEVVTNPYKRALLTESPDMDVIDNILSKAMNPKSAQSAAPAPVPAPVAHKAPQQVAQPAVPQPRAVPPPPTPVSVSVATTSVPLRPVSPAPAPAAESRGKKMSTTELEVAAEALKLLVKHRGGGPFGAGRLNSEAELISLEESLRKTVSVLHNMDSNVAVAAPAPVPAPVARTALPPLPQIPQKPAPAPAPVAAPLPAPVQQQQQMPPAPPADADAPVPIAMGLDQFLQAPRERSNEELNALRDGLIQVLSMIQSELSSRPAAGAGGGMVIGSADAAKAATDRIMRLNAPASANPEGSSAPLPIEQDIKLAMGLLLKHRGGPGFGHGRLEGKELDLMAEKLRAVSQRLVAEASS